jgi:hypothetical protein
MADRNAVETSDEILSAASATGSAETRQLKVGDPVLWYGFELNVVDIIDAGEGRRVADVQSLEGNRVKAEAIQQLKALREQQAPLKAADEAQHAELAAQINELTEKARQAHVSARIRVDLLSYWPEREVWVSDGRIMTDEQIAEFVRRIGVRPKPSAQREALNFIEGR